MDIMDRINDLVQSYGDRLSAVGICCDVRKKYFEDSVSDSYHHNSLLRSIHRHIEEKKERKKYKFVPNRYHVVILQFMPLEKGVLKKEFCREYSFLLKGTGRAHKGLEPEDWSENEERVLSKIKRCIEKILEKAEKSTPEMVCRDRWWDLVFRYMPSNRCIYKKQFLGRDMAEIEIGFLIAALVVYVIAFVVLTVGEIISKM